MSKNKLSSYEAEFIDWLECGYQNGYVKDWYREPKTFLVAKDVTHTFKQYMKTKVKDVEKIIINSIDYTPDFKFKPSKRFWEDFPNAPLQLSLLPDKQGYIWVDIKSKHHGKGTSSNASFPPKRLLMFEKYGIYTTRITLDAKYNLYYYTFASSNYAYDKRIKSRKAIRKSFKNCKLILDKES